MIIPEKYGWKVICNKPLGSGGQGSVYLVTHVDMPDSKFALKVLDQNATQEARTRLRKEFSALGKISNPNIIKIIEYPLPPNDEFLYYVMEYHEGAKTIKEVCLDDPESNPYHGNALKCLDLFEQIINAIRACEATFEPENSIIHRDISPRNILVLPDGSIRLIDFGLCYTEGDETITMTGENVGTRSYAPPECGAFSRFQVGTHTDIFSAAKVLWSVITSKRVFDSHSIEDHTSMRSMFPRNEDTWHLNQVFYSIIKPDPNDRNKSTEHILLAIERARYALVKGFPPLEAVESRCPSCGNRGVRAAEFGRQTFGGHMSQPYFAHECEICGFVFARNTETLKKSLKR